MSPQYPLPLGWAGGGEGWAEFLVSTSNSEAVGYLSRWPDWPHQALVLVGPPKCGKSHLARLMAQRFGVGVGWPAAEARFAVIDDVATALNEVDLFHLYNRVALYDGALLLTSEAPPESWGLTLPDLKSRLAATPRVALGEPDDALLGPLLIRHCAARGLEFPADLLGFTLDRVERSHVGLLSLAEALDRQLLGAGKKLTKALISSSLSALGH
jgi:chromosomal replication initiation ATPase DnaA